MTIRTLVIAGLLAAALSIPNAVLAQQAPPPAAHARYMHRYDDLNLTDQQRSQIQAAMEQYRAAHPKGSEPDPQARKALRDQIMSVLSPDQRAKLMQEQRERRGDKGANPEPTPTP
jgi:Spy/CpxP family protein refolding chaperone